MKSLFSSFLLCLFLSACSNNHESDETQTDDGVETIDVANAKSYEGTLDALIEDLYFVQLEASEEALFSEVSKVLFVDDKIFILDGMSQKILAFSSGGEFLFTVSQKGQGPSEYEEIFSIAYDYDNRQLILGAPGKFLWFDTSGVFIKQEKSEVVGVHINDMAYVGNSQFAIYLDMFGNFGEEAVRAIVIDDNGKRVASYQPFSTAARTENITGMYSHFSSSKEPLAVGVYTHDVWRFRPDGAEVAYRLDFGKDAMPNDFLDTYITDPTLTSAMVRDIIKGKGYWQIYGGALQETDESFFFNYSNSNEYRNGLFNKNTGEGLTFVSQMNNDRGDKGWLTFKGSYNNYFVTPYRSRFLAGAPDFDKLTIDQKKAIELIDEEEIPLLWFVKFKKVNEIEVN
ncbi:MAG: hypothetical protein ACJAS3_001101 [Roseivirga sp.]|jgi:hypothetical protein